MSAKRQIVEDHPVRVGDVAVTGRLAKIALGYSPRLMWSWPIADSFTVLSSGCTRLTCAAASALDEAARGTGSRRWQAGGLDCTCGACRDAAEAGMRSRLNADALASDQIVQVLVWFGRLSYHLHTGGTPAGFIAEHEALFEVVSSFRKVAGLLRQVVDDDGCLTALDPPPGADTPTRAECELGISAALAFVDLLEPELVGAAVRRQAAMVTRHGAAAVDPSFVHGKNWQAALAHPTVAELHQAVLRLADVMVTVSRSQIVGYARALFDEQPQQRVPLLLVTTGSSQRMRLPPVTALDPDCPKWQRALFEIAGDHIELAGLAALVDGVHTIGDIAA